MGASELRRSLACAALAALAFAGCASRGSGDDAGSPAAPPSTLTPPPAPVIDDNPTPPPTPPTSTAGLAGAEPGDSRPVDLTNAAPPGRGDSSLIYIDPAEPESDPAKVPLVAVAAREKARRQQEAAPVLRIDNKNLSSYAAGGVLTIAEADPEDADEGNDGETAGAEGAAAPGSTEESYWRQRGLDIRQRWRDAVERIPELVAKVEGLRQQFYAEDDPAYRDGQIKPAWDKALADLEEARYQAGQGQQEVETFLEEGRRAGALPGWLREGAELEPEPVIEEAEPVDPAEPVEPTILDDEPTLLEPPADGG